MYAHSFRHWRWHLNARILEYLSHEGHLETEKTARQEEWSDERRATFAETTFEAMKADQSMDQLWVSYKDQIERAEGGRKVGIISASKKSAGLIRPLQAWGRRFVKD